MRWMLPFAVLGFCGCGPKMVESDAKPTHPVRGKILFEGQPTPNAVVKFYPVERSSAGRLPTARCQKDGTFNLSTYGHEDGAPEGRYTITIKWNKAGADGESSNDLPPRYARAETSDIPTVEVKPENNELPTINLRR